MVCPYCNKQETNVVDSRKNNEGNSIRRRRECAKCNLRFTTSVSYTHLRAHETLR